DLQVAPDMSQCDVRWLYTAVTTIRHIPSTVKYLRLGVLRDKVTHQALDPGYSDIKQHCPQLRRLAIHVKSETKTNHLACLPNVRVVSLIISDLHDGRLLQWMVDTTRRLQPKSGYQDLILPRCSLQVNNLNDLMGRLGNAGIKVRQNVEISGPISYPEKQQLENTIKRSLNCSLKWKTNDEQLYFW
ncbi:unnamed protein product, partial [Meganyctiphanes norvegica]